MPPPNGAGACWYWPATPGPPALAGRSGGLFADPRDKPGDAADLLEHRQRLARRMQRLALPPHEDARPRQRIDPTCVSSTSAIAGKRTISQSSTIRLTPVVKESGRIAGPHGNTQHHGKRRDAQLGSSGQANRHHDQR
jgi:hypothetical protein